MRERNPGAGSLFTAGILAAGMGLYHFWLPAQFGWGELLSRDRMLRWALLSINAFFSYLLLAGGTLTIVIARRPGPRDSVSLWTLATMIGFWLLNASYQMLFPMPLPKRLAILGWALRAFALIVLALYASGLGQALKSRGSR